MEYVAPTSLDDAIQLARDATGSVRYLAGGTDVLVQLRSGLHQPDLVIDLKRIPGMLDVVRTADGGWKIGAAVPGSQLGAIAELRQTWPGVIEAIELIGSTQIQGRASLAGNLCNGSPAADSVPAMVAAGATVSIVSANGRNRTLAVSEILKAPGKNNLAASEIVTSINLPSRSGASADAYLRFIPRTEMDIAVVGCAVNLTLDGKTVNEASVALGAVAPTVILVPEAADCICGTTLNDAAMEKLAVSCQAACRPIDDKRGTIEFRTDIAGVLAQRTARTAYQRARECK